MSEFKKYAEKLNEMAKAAFMAYRTAEIDTAACKQKLDTLPNKVGMVDEEYAAKYARAKADYLEAVDNLQKAKQKLYSTGDSIRAMRAELAEAVNKKYAADPEQIDSKTLTLLESGVLTPYDFSNLMERAIKDENYTMTKLIAKHAGNAIEKTAAAYGANSPQVKMLRVTQELGKSDPGVTHINAYDALLYIYDRTAKNPKMIDSWDNFTEATIKDF